MTVTLFNFFNAIWAAELIYKLLFEVEPFTIYFWGCPLPISNLLYNIISHFLNTSFISTLQNLLLKQY